MPDISKLNKSKLLELKIQLEKEYCNSIDKNLHLDMSRGKPATSQLDTTNDLLFVVDNYFSEDGIDTRNYGILDGLKECKKLFSDLLQIPSDQIIIGGNSSLNMMYDSFMRLFMFGTQGYTPWSKLSKVKFLCPSPGYDRHFAICEALGIEMITVPMKSNGPDMDIVEHLAQNDEAIKGIWCVPLYSNPAGICYSDEVALRLVNMKTAAPDFRIFWDNAYGVHHIYEETKLLNIFQAAKKTDNEDRILYFFSTSKISFPGSGVSLMASGLKNIAEIKKHMSVQTIGADKINQLRHVKYFKDADGIKAHMKKLAEQLKPKFDIVLNTLENTLGDTGLAHWTKPNGGYFVAVDTLEGCAKRTVELAKNAGVVLTSAGATYPYGKDPLDQNIRLAPSYPTIEELELAMNLFCLCVKLAGVEKLLEQI